MTNALKITAQFPKDAELQKMFGDVNALQRFKVMDRAARAGAKVVVQKAKTLAPRSTEKDRRKRSAKQRASADWDSVPLNKTISYVVRQYDTAGFAAIGPTWPHGNKAYFNQPKTRSRKHILWGVDRQRTYIATRNWMVEAFDTSKDAVLSAMKDAVRKAIDEVMRG